MLSAEQIRKSYGAHLAVAGVSLTVAPGEIVGLLGPNGAGKSTTVNMLCGLTRPDSGSVKIDGAVLEGDANPLKRRIGLVPQDIALYEDLGAAANLHLFGALYGLERRAQLSRAAEVLQLVGLADRAKDKPATFSGGMKRRLNIACALMHDPDLIVLDEPTAGVDPQSRNAIFDALEALRARGKALIYTTHYMEEAERLCDRIIIIDHGQVVASDTLHGLYARLPAALTLEIALDPNAAGALDLAALAGQADVVTAKFTDGLLQVGIADLTRGTAAVTAWLAQQGQVARSINSGRANLEDVFLALTGRQLRD